MCTDLIKISAIIITVIFMLSTFTACKSREEITHSDIVKYTENAIGEDISLINVDGEETDDLITYTFNIDKRNIPFTVTSFITAMFVDGTQMSGYYEEIVINYEEQVAEYYTSERNILTQKYNLNYEDLDYGLSIIHVQNYNDIDNLSKFITELDKLYAFKETKANCFKHIDSGAISFSNSDTSIDGILFSTKKKNRLKYDDVSKKIEEAYVLQLKKFNCTDDSIPPEIFNKYQIE